MRVKIRFQVIGLFNWTTRVNLERLVSSWLFEHHSLEMKNGARRILYIPRENRLDYERAEVALQKKDDDDNRKAAILRTLPKKSFAAKMANEHSFTT